MSIKKLNTKEKRKRVFNNTFKRDKDTGHIIMKAQLNIMYETYDKDVIKDIDFYEFFQIIHKNEDYTDFFLRKIYFGPSKSKFPGENTLSEDIKFYSGLTDTTCINIKYNKCLDMFVVITSTHNNDYNMFSLFNNSKNFGFYLWENSIPTLKNAFVANSRYRNIFSSELDPEIFNIIKNNSFDSMYKQIWKETTNDNVEKDIYIKQINNLEDKTKILEDKIKILEDKINKLNN